MSRKTHTIKELKAFKILRDAKKHKIMKLDKQAYMMKHQQDKPDFGFVIKKNTSSAKQQVLNIGIEVCSIDNPKLMESRNVHQSPRENKAKQEANKAILEGRPYTYWNHTTSVTSKLFQFILEKKFTLYNDYKKDKFASIFLLLHIQSFDEINLSHALRFHLNHFCINKNCPFDKVFLVDLKHKVFIGTVFDKKTKRRLDFESQKKLGNLESEQSARHFFPFNEKMNLWGNYK